MWWLLPTALASTVTLHVGVHVDAGTIADIAVDGAAGQCRVEPARLICPAEDTVHFRWGPDEPEWALSGDLSLPPGAAGTAFVLAPEGSRTSWRARLMPEVVTAQDVRDAFLRHGRVEPPVPSPGMLGDLDILTVHPDPTVRIAVAEAFHSVAAGSSSNPFPRTAPLPLPPGVLSTLASDRDWRVRIRCAQLMGEIRNTGLQHEVVVLLEQLTEDPKPLVRRAAVRGLGLIGEQSMVPPEQAWSRALRMAVQPKGPGRAAMHILARLASWLEPSEEVDPSEAVEIGLANHPDLAWLVWKRWREHLPYDPVRVRRLLRETPGMNPVLVRHLASQDPEDLAEAFAEWEPVEVQPPSRRFRLAQVILMETEHAGLRSALRLDVDPPPLDVQRRPSLHVEEPED